MEVTGSKVNRGAGYGLEVPCKYHFFGPEVYLLKMKAIVDKLMDYSKTRTVNWFEIMMYLDNFRVL